MESKKIKKTILIAFFVSISAQINFEFLTEGFIVAMSSVVMAIFVYCYEDLSPAYIIILSGIFSPLFRYVTICLQTGIWGHSALIVLPDMIFFFSYAAIYVLLYKFVFKAPKSLLNFPAALFFCDMLSNTMEMLTRSVITGTNFFTPQLVAILAMIAICRTTIIMMVILAIDAYGNFLISKEHDEEYKRLLIQASAVEGEMRIMAKNIKEVEGVMKKAYDLYYQARDMEYPKDITDSILEIAKDTHEIKGDYQNVLGVLNDTFLGNLKDESLSISEIISLEKANVLALIRKSGAHIEISSKIRTDFEVTETFKLMSVIRNLLTNSMEALGKGPGKITIKVVGVNDDSESPDDEPFAYQISVRDNGPGIPEDEIGNIFLEGYSTKFDPVTGNIERGLGLCLVKDYIENDFKGTIRIDSKVGSYTEFILTIPHDMV